MALAIDPAAVNHGIQLALAPVFLLTAVSGMIAAVAGRLARIIDRARRVEEQALATSDPQLLERAWQELEDLRVRGRLSNGCIALLTCCAFLIGITVILLFVGQTTSVSTNWPALGCFLLGVGTFLMALLCFLWETWLATRVLDFHVVQRP